MGEHDNSGFPLAYCLLTTATSIIPGKRKIALTSFLKELRDKYSVHPRFVHTDKDIAEIKAAHSVWVSSKHQLCWWHVKKAVNSRLKNGKLSTTPYDPKIAKAEFPFIDLSFVPSVKPDPKDDKDPENPPETLGPTHISSPTPTIPPPSIPPPTLGPNSLPIKIKIPAGLQLPPLPEAPEDPSYEEGHTQSFCPSIYHEHIIQMMERHLCAHPLIPGYSAPTREGIRAWAVKEIYSFCVKYNLRSCWAYLWGNWYRKDRWKLWARAECEEIPLLKTTMICES